jgi:hypothetical protein
VGVTMMCDGYFTLPLIPSHLGRGKIKNIYSADAYTKLHLLRKSFNLKQIYFCCQSIAVSCRRRHPCSCPQEHCLSLSGERKHAVVQGFDGFPGREGSDSWLRHHPGNRRR